MPDFHKNMELPLEITDLSAEGEGIGKYEGYTVFIKDTVPGDKVLAALTKVKKTYAYARPVKVLQASPDRVTPACTVAGPCGGCQLQALSYTKQLEFKAGKVRNNLERIGGLQPEVLDAAYEPILGMEDPWHYRNKAQFPIRRGKDGRLTAGFFAGRTHHVIPAGDCVIGTAENARILDLILEHMRKHRIDPYDEESGKGLVRHVLIRKGFETGELLVCLIQSSQRLPGEKDLIRELSVIPGMKSISINVNRERTNVILGKELRLLWGEPYIKERIGSLTYRISPLSFFQVNPVQTLRLYEKVREYAGLTGKETVWDLYCGAGTISLFLARDAARICGVEIVPEAIRDAEANAVLNGIGNARFYTGKAEEVFPSECTLKGLRADVAVLDPPRKGCEKSLLDSLIRTGPERIVYVSCDSATLARDLKYLDEGGYRLRRYCPVDMFPMTVHVETCVLLVRESISDDEMVSIKVDLDGIALDQGRYVPPEKPTYKNIKQWISDKYGFNVSTLYIAQIKDKVGMEKRKNYNPGSGEGRVPVCPPEKEEAIMDAFRHFDLI